MQVFHYLKHLLACIIAANVKKEKEKSKVGKATRIFVPSSFELQYAKAYGLRATLFSCPQCRTPSGHILPVRIFGVCWGNVVLKYHVSTECKRAFQNGCAAALWKTSSVLARVELLMTHVAKIIRFHRDLRSQPSIYAFIIYSTRQSFTQNICW